MNTQDIGKAAEEKAKKFLCSNNLTLITANYFCRQGEIDLIMRDRGSIVFVEVKFRKNTHYGTGLEMVTRKKQRKIIATAKHYLHKHGLTEKVNCRFDIVTLESKIHSTEPTINWLKNAFY